MQRFVRKFSALSMVAVAVMLSACADLQTIGRRTALPNNNASDPYGVAIHLDANQRLVIVQGQKYCAEPSPDAFAAYAASLGLGISAPTQGAASAAQALQSSAGSIGLRTQSITLMRDALYRMCEAANNANLNRLEVAAFLRRSQDLTAVVLAIEQLTGAVAANQVVLTGNSSAEASANLLANQNLLDQAKALETKRAGELEDANSALKAEEGELKSQGDNVEVEQKAYEAAYKADPNNQATLDAKESWDAAVERRDAQFLRRNKARENVDRLKAGLDDAKDVRSKVEANRNAALTGAGANAGGDGRFSIVTPAKALDKEATQAISSAVTEMVKTVLNKRYSLDSCMSYLIEVSPKKIDGEAGEDLVKLCKELFAVSVKEEINKGYSDRSAEELARKLKNGMVTPAQVQSWLKSKGMGGVAVPNLLHNQEYESVRAAFLKSLP